MKILALIALLSVSVSATASDFKYECKFFHERSENAQSSLANFDREVKKMKTRKEKIKNEIEQTRKELQGLRLWSDGYKKEISIINFNYENRFAIMKNYDQVANATTGQKEGRKTITVDGKKTPVSYRYATLKKALLQAKSTQERSLAKKTQGQIKKLLADYPEYGKIVARDNFRDDYFDSNAKVYRKNLKALEAQVKLTDDKIEAITSDKNFKAKGRELHAINGKLTDTGKWKKNLITNFEVAEQVSQMCDIALVRFPKVKKAAPKVGVDVRPLCRRNPRGGWIDRQKCRMP